MSRFPFQYCLVRLLSLYFLVAAPVAAVEALKLQWAALEYGPLSTGALELAFDPLSADSGVSIKLSDIRSPLLAQPLDLSLVCGTADWRGNSLRCLRGKIQLSMEDGTTLTGETDLNLDTARHSADLVMRLAHGAGKLFVRMHNDDVDGWHMEINGQAIPATVFNGILSHLLPQSAGQVITAGELELRLSAAGLGDKLHGGQAELETSGLSMDGESILEGIDLTLSLALREEDGSYHLKSDAKLGAGEMYLQVPLSVLGERPGFYLDMEQKSVSLQVDANWQPGSDRLSIDSFNYQHPGLLSLEGSAAFNDKRQLQSARIRARIDSLARGYPVYLQPLLLQTNFSDLELAGKVDISLDYDNEELAGIDLHLEDVYLDDLKQRFSIAGLDSEFHVQRDDEPIVSSLSWAGGSLYRLDLGSGSISFESRGRDVRVTDWQDVSILDGALVIRELEMSNLAGPDFELRLGGELKPVSMELLTHAFDWTVFSGQLSGVLSGLVYHHNQLQLDGDINVSVFDGQLAIRELRVQDLFSTYAIMTTNIQIDKLDLERLTDVFTFGRIEGSLSGQIDKLRLEDWKPAYFEAEIATPTDDERPHRISQRALENLNELGGGLSGSLSRGFLRFLPAYSYGRLSISCRLYNGVCELGGVEEKGEQFWILTRGGMLPPWVEVRGAGRAIRWTDLVDGLEQITSGEIEIQ